jgi:hypothetical protein
MAEEPEKAFSCSVDNLKSIVEIVNCLSSYSNKNQECHIEATPTELILIVTGKSKATQARITLQEELFEEFLCAASEDESISFVVNLNVFLDCLSLFGISSENIAATMSYSTRDEIFRISLEELGVITTCDISALYRDETDEMSHHSLFTEFRDTGEVCQIIIKSEPLREAIAELTDCFWAGSVGFEVCSNPGFMKLSTGGAIGVSEIKIPTTSDAIVSFRCSANPDAQPGVARQDIDAGSNGSRKRSAPTADDSLKSSYPLKSLLTGMKALGVAKETFIRLNAQGMMCIQHQIQTSKGIETYVDFMMVAEDAGVSGEGD